MIIYSQLTLVSLDALGGTEAFPRVDVAHVSMAVTLTHCRQKGGRGDGMERGRNRYVRILFLKILKPA